MKKTLGFSAIAILLLLGFWAWWLLKTPPVPGPQLGFNYTAWWSGRYGTEKADRSLEELAAIGAGWVAPVVTAYIADIGSTTIDYSSPRTPTDEDLGQVFAKAHELGLEILLKPHVDLMEEKGSDWRGTIGSPFESDEDWTSWFSAYEEMILHYARLADASGVEEFCVGVELDSTVSREREWRDLIERIREVYDGPLVYAANHAEPEKVGWWDAVDFIGVDAYYSLTESASPTESEVVEAWRVRANSLKELSERWDRKILITEVGYRSVDGALREPWIYHSEPPLDLLEQERGYRVLYETVFDAEWFAGVFFWDWSYDPDIGGSEDRGYTPRGKPAEEVVRAWFSAGPDNANPG
jgi:glycosyl hydrolase family 113